MTTENVKSLYLILDGGLNGKFKFNTKNCIGKGAFGKLFKGQNFATWLNVFCKHKNSLTTQNKFDNYTLLLFSYYRKESSYVRGSCHKNGTRKIHPIA